MLILLFSNHLTKNNVRLLPLRLFFGFRGLILRKKCEKRSVVGQSEVQAIETVKTEEYFIWNQKLYGKHFFPMLNKFVNSGNKLNSVPKNNKNFATMIAVKDIFFRS